MSTSGGNFAGNVPQPSGTVDGPDAFGAAAAAGIAATFSRGDHKHGLPVNPAPAAGNTVVGPDAFGAAATPGVAVAYSRTDHDHGLPANPAPGPAITVTGPDAFGAAAVVGTSLLYARADHDHGLPANPAPVAGNTVVGPDTFGHAAAAGASAAYSRADHDHGLPAAPTPGLTLIASSVLGADAASVIFSSIPGTFNHLRLLAVARSSVAAVADSFALIFNNDTATPYDLTWTGIANNGAVTAQRLGGGNMSVAAASPAGDLAGATSVAGAVGLLELDIPQYAATAWMKIVKWRSGFSAEGLTNTSEYSATGLWRSTTAIATIKLLPQSSANFKAGSAFFLYGVT